MIDPRIARSFLAHDRIAVAGASDDPSSFGRKVYEELRKRGYDVFAVNPNATTVLGDECFPALSSLPVRVDGVIVMVNREIAPAVVRDAIDVGITRVWRFKGLGAPGAVSEEAVALCRDAGVDVVAGACPMMFLEPVRGLHRFHRWVRRVDGSLDRSVEPAA